MLHYGFSASLHYRLSEENSEGERVRFGRVVPDGGTFRQYENRKMAKAYNQLCRLLGTSDARSY
jgi:hypothetical protein